MPASRGVHSGLCPYARVRLGCGIKSASVLGVLMMLVWLPPHLACAQNVRVELQAFQSVTLSDREFLTGRVSGKPVTLAGVLRLPQSDTAALPAVILLHGSNGISGMEEGWIRVLNDMGVATFMIDSYTGRGITSTVNDQAQLGRLAMIIDAYRALELLARHRGIDPGKIAVMGFSRGGQAALYSSVRRFQHMYLKNPAASFAGHLVFYSPCNTRYLHDEDVAHSPIRIFQGDADDFVALAPCQSYVDRLQKAHADAELTVYPGARHLFDNAAFKTPLRIPGAQVTRRCTLEEAADGMIIESASRTPFSYGDSCVDRGVTVEYNDAARSKAELAVRELLTGAFGHSVQSTLR
jgi:dienelactone hydrolase